MRGSGYIRPIILFQAEPKITKNKATFEKIKKRLMERGIVEEQIAIKTSEVDDLTGVDLLSRECPVRYIITVNALKEGWDCPFAYILATLANKTSQVDVEQILGRVLRQPYTRIYEAQELNMSYVLTCSNDFHATLKNVVAGLNHAGFSEKDFRAVDEVAENGDKEGSPQQEKLDFGDGNKEIEQSSTGESWTEEKSEPMQETDKGEDVFVDMARDSYVNDSLKPYMVDSSTEDMIKKAEEEAADYTRKAEQVEHSGVMTGELGKMQKQYKLQAEFAEEALKLRLPQFFLETGSSSLLGNGWELLEPDNLTKGFSLREQDTEINFQLATGEVYEVNLAEQGEAIPKYKKLAQKDSQRFREYLAQLAPAKRQEECVAHIALMLSKNNNGIADQEISSCVQRVVEGMTEEELSALESSLPLLGIFWDNCEEVGKGEV